MPDKPHSQRRIHPMHQTVSASPSQATAEETPYAIPHGSAPHIPGALVTLLTMLLLKRHYSLATADQLDWILAPTARLVAWLTPAHPVYEYGVGYVDFSHGIIVAPACAGINFMIMAFGLATLCNLANSRRICGTLSWLGLALGLAYGYTLVVNALRIAVSMALYKAEIYGAWLTMERLHRVAGITLYAVALWLFFMALQTIIDCYCRRLPCQIQNKRQRLPAWLPFGWYVTGAAGVPVANLMFQQGAPGLVEHCLTIGVTVISISMLFYGLKILGRHLTPYLYKKE